MSDTEKIQQPIAPLTPAEPPPATPAVTEAPLETTKAADPAKLPAGRSERPGKQKPSGGQGGNPRRRMREPIPSLDEPRFQHAPSMRDLDAEIEGELEAALAGMASNDLLAAETSETVRKKAETAPDHGRKKGKVISIHGQDVFVEIPGGRSQGVLPIMQFPEGAPKPGTEVDISIE